MSIPDWVRRRLGLKRAVRRLFLTDTGELNADAKLLFTDLRKFCFVDDTTAKRGFNEMVLAHGEGRRDVWLRLMKLMQPDSDLLRQMETITDD